MLPPRLPDWPERLFAYLDLVRAAPYDPVAHNCATFAAGGLYAMTGRSAIERLGLDLPETPLGVARLLQQLGGVEGLARQYFGVEPLPATVAARGDIVIKEGTDGDTLGICVGGEAVFVAEGGIQARPLAECRGCWKVPA